MREIINWNDNWLFTKETAKTEPVSLPHTWNGEDGQDGGNDYKRIVCKYTKTFDRPDMTGKNSCLIVFHGVNSEAKVKVNGIDLVRHEGGYSTFLVDITDVLQDENEIEVEVSNEKNNKVYPQKADFTFYGGIYRDVEMQLLPKKCFKYREYAAPSLQITPVCQRKGASVDVDMLVSEPCQVNIRLLDADENEVTNKTINIDSKDGHGKIQFNVDNVHKWNGLSDPYLYRVNARIYEENEVVDEVSTNIGFREFRVDPEKGFFLNGKSYPLRGVCRHQDRPKVGNAITRKEHDEDMELIREIGANTIRLAHYQHDQYFYDLCDRYGMVVWAEIPYISEHMPNGRDNTISQMKELILQNYNHPSIVTWGLSNEITISTRNTKDMLDNHRVLNDLCHEMDRTRFTSLACFAMCNPFSKIAHLSDVVSYNLYLGWYVPGLFLNDVFLKLFHLRYPKRCIGYSEYGAEAMTNLHSESPRRGDHTEEYQAIYHEYLIKCINKYPFMWATHVWNMFDFAADARDQGGEPGMNHKGLVTFDRKIKKDSFYLYKAYWTKEPMIHICSKRFVERGESKIQVKVYSNQPQVELYHNGTFLEKQQNDRVFRFCVKLVDGENQIEARVGNEVNIKDEVVFIKKNKPKSYKLAKKKKKSANWV